MACSVLICSDLAMAQLRDNSVIEFNQFFQNYTTINPASNDSIHKMQINLGNRTFTGLFEGVNRNYIDLSFKFNTNSSQFSKIGVLITRHNDGEYTSRTKAYGRYSWTSKLDFKSSISAGLALGIVNYTFLPSQAGGGGSSNVMDGNLGLWYLRKKMQVGVSYQQFLQSEITPVAQKFKLIPTMNINLLNIVSINPNLNLKIHSFFIIQSSQYYNLQVAPVFTFYNKLETGVNIHYKKGYSVLLGIQSIPVGKGVLKFMGSFLIRTSRFSNSADSIFELSGGYSF